MDEKKLHAMQVKNEKDIRSLKNYDLNQRVQTLEAKTHEHENKALLDSISQTHSHANKALLDSLSAEKIDLLQRLGVDSNGKLTLDGVLV